MKSTPRHGRPKPGRLAAALVGVTVVSIAWSATTATAAPSPTIDLKVLVLDDGQPMVGALRSQLEREGVPFTRVDLNDGARPSITSSFLASPGPKGAEVHYQAVIAPTSAPAQLSAGELDALYSFERSYGIRQVSAYDWPSTAVGLDTPHYSGAVDGFAATVTPSARAAGFGYLTGTLTFDDFDPAVTESYGYVARPATGLPAGSSYESYLSVQGPDGVTGSVMGVHEDTGREDLVLTFAQNEYQQHSAVLGHGIIEWATRGIHLGSYRNYFAVHIDDVFVPDGLWSTEGNCTIGSGCDPVAYPPNAPGATSRMTADDAVALAEWQKQNGMRLDVAFNGFGVGDQIARTGSDPLYTTMAARSRDYRWVNHTWSHEYLGCVRDESVSPWACAKAADGSTTYVPLKLVRSQIADNVAWAQARGLAVNPKELVTGEHSGLASLPQMPKDNPNLVTALARTGVSWVASDASREKAQRAIGSALTVPRYPMNVYYNAETVQQQADEYNWIYTSRAQGGSGLCEERPETTTCVEPVDVNTGYVSTIVPREVRAAMRHITTNDPRPHYAHQSNLAGDRTLYPVVDGALREYRSVFDTASTPIVNPTLADSGTILRAQATWKADQGAVTAKLVKDAIVLTSTKATSVPVSATLGANAVMLPDKYAQSSTATLAVGRNRTVKIALSTVSPYRFVAIPKQVKGRAVRPSAPVSPKPMTPPTVIVPLPDQLTTGDVAAVVEGADL